MKTRFISDLHFGHESIIRFDNRPFTSVQEMNETLINNWNEVVDKGDLTYVLGDLIWKDENVYDNILSKLNGQIILIRGNHCKFLHNAKNKSRFSTIKDYDEINIQVNGVTRKVVLSHYFIPMYNGHFHNAIMLHGHSHCTKEHYEELKFAKYLNDNDFPNEIYNVGAMLPYMNYFPRTLEEIINSSCISENSML